MSTHLMEKLENKPKFILKAVISRKLKCFKNHLPPLHFCGTLASALTQHNKASGSDIPLSKPAHATGVFQHNTCFHMWFYLRWQIWSTPARTNLKNTALQIVLFIFLLNLLNGPEVATKTKMTGLSLPWFEKTTH